MSSLKLRVAGGTARGIPLTEPRGVRLRPTTGKVREAVFNILGEAVEGAKVLDLFAGTGALGIEALSRGAGSALFVEAEAACCTAILDSLARVGLADRGTVLRGRLPAAMRNVTGPFDLILLDPPYGANEIEELLHDLASLIAPGGTIVYEHANRYNPPERPNGLKLTDRRLYGDSAIAFFRVQEG
jgi:16S rRNA (guanine966-N2)-methyltransferase